MFDLKCIDCREGLKEIPDNSIDMCLTDPPYGLDGLDETWDAEIIEKKKPKSGDKAVISNLPVGMKFDPKQGQNFQNFYKPICDEIYRVLKPGGFFLTFSQARLYHHAAIAVENAGFEIRDMLGWIYTKSTQGKAFGQNHLIDINAELSKEEKDAAKKICKGWKTPQLKPAIEPICFAQKPKENQYFANFCKYGVGLLDMTMKVGENNSPAQIVVSEDIEPELSKYFLVPKPTKEEKGETTHITVKPIALCEHLIRLCTKEGAVILDPFNGSGTTGLSAHISNRSYIGFELEKEYYEISLKRLENLIDTSESFEELFR